MAEGDCIFCGIAAGTIPATVIHEDERTLAFMDINPATRGHCLVIPKVHSDDILSATSEDLAACSASTQLLSDRVISKLGADGVAVASFCRPAAGQTVFHLHFHVLPRYVGDGMLAPWTPTPGDPAEIEAAAKEMRT